MSGGIYLANRRYWSCAGWLFDLVLRVLADKASRPSLATLLLEVIESGVGVLDSSALTEPDQADLVRAIQDNLDGAVDSALGDAEQIDVAAVLSQVRALAHLTVDRARLTDRLEKEAAPVPQQLWTELADSPVGDSAFVDFMATWGGSAVYEVWAKVLSFGFTRFLSGETGADSVRFQWELLDDDLRHLLPFASNDHGGRFFFHSGDGSIWYGNVETTQEKGLGGRIADSFSDFLEMINLDDEV